MNIALWIVQVLVGAFFVYHTSLMYRPPAKPQSGMRYMREMAPGLRIFAGRPTASPGLPSSSRASSVRFRGWWRWPQPAWWC
ncbi:MAG TPA: hypothetical protein VGK42_12075 [Candidatus Dormibacteraeota bacterium]